MTPSLEGRLTKAKEAPSRHEVKLAPLDTNPVFQCLGGKTDRLAPAVLISFHLTIKLEFCLHFSFSMVGNERI